MSAAVRTRSSSSSSRRSDGDSPAIKALGSGYSAHSHSAHGHASSGIPAGSLLPPALAADNGDVIHSVAHFTFPRNALASAETERLLPSSTTASTAAAAAAAAGAGVGVGGRRVSFSDSTSSSGSLLGSNSGLSNSDAFNARSHSFSLYPSSNDADAGAGSSLDADDSSAKRRDLLLLGGIFLTCVLVVVALWLTAPELPAADAAAVRLPRSMAQLRALVDVVTRYKGEHFMYVCALFSAVYVFLQMFAIPGAVFLSILAGPLFGLVPGMFVISTVATTGTTICYLLSSALGRRLVKSRFPDLLASMQARVDAHRGNLLFYMLFLRVTPLLPNWFINVSSPIVGVPLHVFIAATYIGLMPGNYVHLSTGLALNSVAEDKPLMTPGTVLFLFVVGAVALLPLLFKKKLEAYDKAAVQQE